MRLHKTLLQATPYYNYVEGDDAEDEEECYQVASGSDLTCFLLIPLFVGLIICVVLANLFGTLEKRGFAYAGAQKILWISFVLILMSGFMAFGVCQYYNPCLTFSLWFNGDLGITFATVAVGMGSNLIFGFIDNAGLFFGCSYLDEIFSKLPGANDTNVCAGYGNTFSDFLGSFMGTFCGMMIAEVCGISEGPLWANSFGIILGCLLGILIPKMIVSNSETKGLNKINASNALLGTLSEEELQAIIDQQPIDKVKAKITFKQLDANDNKYVSKEEIKAYLKKSMGDDWSEKAFADVIKQYFDVSLDDRVNDYNIQEFEVIYRNLARESLRAKRANKQGAF